MAVYRRSTRPRFTLLLLVLTAVTIITVDFRGDAKAAINAIKGTARDAFAPVQRLTAGGVRPVGDFLDGVLHAGDLKAENARLRAQLQETEARRVQADDAERERKALLDQQQLSFLGDIPTVPARVVQESTSNFDLTIEIDRGTNAGVLEGMPVVASAGLVGRVVETSRTRSTVLLMSDPGASVGVRIDPSGEVGVASGDSARRGQLKIDLVDPSAKVENGDAVVTSGLQQSVFPPGIPVGRVVSARAAPGALQQEVGVRPVVDLRRLTFVKVLQWSPRP